MKLFAWVLSVIYLIVFGIPIAIGLLILLQIISIIKFFSNVRKKEKSIIVHNYLYGLITFLSNHRIPFTELEGGKIEIFYPSELTLFQIGYHFGRFAEMQHN